MVESTNRMFVSTHAAALQLGYSRGHITYLYRTNQLKGMKPARDILIAQTSVDAYRAQYHGARKRGPKQNGSQNGKSPAIRQSCKTL